MITKFGEAYFMHRCIDDEFSTSSMYIAIGNGKIPVRRLDRKLGNEITRKKCTSNVDLKNNLVILATTFSLSEIMETTEIGVIAKNAANEDILISHDIYNQLDKSVFNSINEDITVEYAYRFTNSFQKNVWTLFDESSGIYYAYEENLVLKVFENNSGYRKVSSLNELKNTIGAFYQDLSTKNLYINPIGDVTKSDIVIQV